MIHDRKKLERFAMLQPDRVRKWCFIICAVILSSVSVIGQADKAVGSVAVPLPKDETFVEATGLAAPWGEGGCPHSTDDRYNPPNCYLATVADQKTFHRVSIYDADGTVWHSYSILRSDPNFFRKVSKHGFIPFTVLDTHSTLRESPVLRVVGESPNWIEVEINEETRETRFVSKNEYRTWVRRDWDYWLRSSGPMTIGAETKLLDKPNGAPIEHDQGFDHRVVRFVDMDGDWAYVDVRTAARNGQRGWVRWRNGRKILIGCILNDGSLVHNPDSNFWRKQQ